ncbi:NUDIX domain-containing protein [Variovorax sp. J22R133]|uniref:NUDIX domain-containing protein n=1 Tax=Variovorax brevis TaxID=3053503 RepID=UPI002577473A|nr:NUDIX domain-containing protein [Variovorax sp. J22R133]MDM0116332.1 NUDIX domain-containing protein [Variovorax sp. J22R133]
MSKPSGAMPNAGLAPAATRRTILRIPATPRRSATQSAGLLMYRRTGSAVEVFLVHPGGPLWVRRDLGAWSIPKGEFVAGAEAGLDAARREFFEETGFAPGTHCASLGEARLRSGKLIHAWAFEGDADPSRIVSNTFDIEWPPRSGQLRTFPEVDRAAWFTIEAARVRIHEGQQVFVERLLTLVS